MYLQRGLEERKRKGWGYSASGEMTKNSEKEEEEAEWRRGGWGGWREKTERQRRNKERRPCHLESPSGSR